jgi:hypothetical protein
MAGLGGSRTELRRSRVKLGGFMAVLRTSRLS